MTVLDHLTPDTAVGRSSYSTMRTNRFLPRKTTHVSDQLASLFAPIYQFPAKRSAGVYGAALGNMTTEFFRKGTTHQIFTWLRQRA